uniref:Uncharacterized protein n=1 Tax=Microcystis aeruginosa (strain PCC 7806) TaxID=267872 RepID=A8YN58_MICA7|nr:unnamed protein product [Microcystis aeruginosa PCC 7806]
MTTKNSSLPIRSNRISWKPNPERMIAEYQKPLPIRSNRISWKRSLLRVLNFMASPYLLGQIGLVGNMPVFYRLILELNLPYLLGQIGLVGNEFCSVYRFYAVRPYLLGQIGLVGNENIPVKPS